MSSGTRLGILGLILACIGIGISVLWPNVRWVGWGAIVVAIGLGIYWAIQELRRPRRSPSFVFVFGAPLGDNNSPDWIMLLKHFGPNTAFNCDIGFFDQDRKNIEHQWLIQNPNSPYPPPNLAGKSQERFHIPEAETDGAAGSFQWTPVDPDRQHYIASISCRDGIFEEHWEVVRVDGVLRSKIRIERGPDWKRKNRKLDAVVFECIDPEFVNAPLAVAFPQAKRKRVHPGWKPNHRFELPAAIIDPNGHVQVAGVKLPDGSVTNGSGCWSVLTKHLGDDVPSRVPGFLRRCVTCKKKYVGKS